MEKVNLNLEEKNVIFYLNKCLGLEFQKKEMESSQNVRKILLLAWSKSDRNLHDWGISRFKINALSARVSGFKHFVFHHCDSVLNALSPNEVC